MLRIERDGPGDLEEARQLLLQAITHQQRALKINPRNPDYRRFLRNHYQNLAETLLLLGDHSEAAQAASELPRIFPTGWEEYYRSARFLARCIPLAEKDLKLSEPERQTLAQSHAEHAVVLLKAAINQGFRDHKQLNEDVAFDSLRMHQHFRRLVDSLEHNAK
jgi:tetratricopeptide (TPR) repeat protein